jgi:predicted O-linked N-acetylglucosamine transferase (SPINDLY family)
MGEFALALEDYRRAVSLDPLAHFTFGDYLHTASILCQWDVILANRSTLEGKLDQAHPVCAPFPILSLSDDPKLHLKCAQFWVSLCLRPSAELGFSEINRLNCSKIRIAYISADFHGHATSYLIAQLLEEHDRSRFEIIGVTFGPDRDDPMRRRVKQAFDHFIDVRLDSDIEIAYKIRTLGIDIAIDLKGHTQDSRPGIFAERCAPIQVSYLGYPGSMGASFIDYIVADPIVIPPDDVQYYSEKVIWLPHSYQANDRKRVIASTVYQRQALGLPEKGFIFCCFNNSYKIRCLDADLAASLG